MRRSLLVFLVGPVSLLTSIQLAFADTSVVTDPVGFTTTPLSGNSDTFVSVLFTRPPVFIGAILSASGNTITVAGNPWMANQFVYGGTQHDHFYALIGSFTPTTSPPSLQTRLRVPDYSAAGINLPYAAEYYFFNNAWRHVSDGADGSDANL